MSTCARVLVMRMPAADENPWQMFQGAGGDLLLLLALIPLAVLVLWVGGRQLRRQRGSSTLRPKGRSSHLLHDATRRRGQKGWLDTIERLERGPFTPIAEAHRGPVRLLARIVDASSGFGEGATCVWRNRPGGRPESAVGAELVIVADDSGRCGVENLESAHVIAPIEHHTVHYDSISLNIGDEVEIFGFFEPERVGDDPDPRKLVYGTLGANAELEVRRVRSAKGHQPPPPSAEGFKAPP